MGHPKNQNHSKAWATRPEKNLESAEFNDVVAAELRERLKSTEYMQAIKNTSILNEYCEGKYSLVLKGNLVVEEVNSYGTVFGSEAEGTKLFHFTVFLHNPAFFNGTVGLTFKQEEMLVRNVQIVENLDRVNLPAEVRLHLIHDELVQFGAKGRYFVPSKSSFHVLGGLYDGKFDPVPIKRDVFLFEDSDPSKFESGPQVVNGVSSNTSKLFQARFQIFETIVGALAASVRINLNHGAIAIFKKPDTLIEFSDVLIGPIELQEGIGEIAHDGDSTVNVFG